MGSAKRGLAVLAVTAGLVLTSASAASATSTMEETPAAASEPNCLVVILTGTLADPVGTVVAVVSDPVGTVTGVAGCVVSLLG